MDDRCPSVWPEEKPPAGAESCMDCELNKHGSRMIWGEGNPDAPIMVVLDNPGAREDREGNPFICGTRDTLQQAVHQVGMGIEDLYVTYLAKRRPTRAYDKAATRERCLQHLLEQLGSKSPRFVVCLGNVATQWFFADGAAEVKTLRQGWHTPRGFNTTVTYHPLAVRRRPNLWPYFVEDWRFLMSAYKTATGKARMIPEAIP